MTQPTILARFALQGLDQLQKDDPLLSQLLSQEYQRQHNTLAMVAASSLAVPSVLACEGTVISNITTEGYPGARFHGGCHIVDEIEKLAVERAKEAFHAKYANVQPHSGTSANEIVLFSLLEPGDTLLGLDLNAGGHLTHGSAASLSGRYFRAIGYGLNEEGGIDYEQVRQLARQFRPKLIICGASAYPRTIYFERFREIADEVHAFLLADISHIAGLVVAGLHSSPINYAHFTTTSTYKQLYGPRGGLILMGNDYHHKPRGSQKTLAEIIQRAVFPSFQGTPHLNTIAAKARALDFVQSPQFQELAQRIVDDAKALASGLLHRGYQVLTGGTDNHLILINILAHGMTGSVAERALEECNIIVNKNRIPGDTKKASITSGLRMGTNCLAARGLGEKEMLTCVDFIHTVLSSLCVVDDHRYTLPESIREAIQAEVQLLCKQFPLPYYPQEG